MKKSDIARYHDMDQAEMDYVATRLRKLSVKELRVLADHYKLVYDRDCRKDFFIDELTYIVWADGR